MSELNAYARLVDDLRDIAARGDAARRNDLVHLRRQLGARIGNVRRVGNSTFADTALIHEFRTQLSQIQHQIALHQAKWPAVMIDDDDENYRRSAQQLAEANHAFIAWTREAVGRA